MHQHPNLELENTELGFVFISSNYSEHYEKIIKDLQGMYTIPELNEENSVT
jgi:hypothetical protein